MKKELPHEIFTEECQRLFDTAKEKDEFEYVCNLINYNGMGDPRALSHIYESRDLFFQMVSLIEKSKSLHEQTRLFLLLYCHIFEMDEFYNIIGNMLRISLGERHAIKLYNSPTIKTELKPANKLEKLECLAKKVGFELLIKTIKDLYSSSLRNSFFHSSYSLSEDYYVVISGKELKINGTSKTVASIQNEIIPITQSTVNIAGNFFNLIRSSQLAYKENKIVPSRLIPTGIEVEIIGHPERGLSGFQTV